MDQYGTERLATKDAQHTIVARISEDFNLTPVLARAHYEQMARYFADVGQLAREPGELCYLAVAAEEPRQAAEAVPQALHPPTAERAPGHRRAEVPKGSPPCAGNGCCAWRAKPGCRTRY